MIISLLLVSAVAASAQVPADLDAAFAKASSQAAASRERATAPVPVVQAILPITSCPDAKELEVPFSMTLTMADGRTLKLKLDYAGCEEEGRNDYLPPYTTRTYKGQEGYALTLVTNEGASASDVLLSKGKEWVGRFGEIENAEIVSGATIPAGALEGSLKGKADFRNSAAKLYSQAIPCEQALKQAFGVTLRDSDGQPATGYGQGFALVLLTATDAYYHHEDCDICAEVTKCSLSSHVISSVIVAHSVDCADMKPYSKNAVYDACASR